MDRDWERFKNKQYNLYKLFTNDINYKKEYFEYRMIILLGLYAKYDINLNGDIDILGCFEKEIKIIDKKGYDLGVYDELIEKFTLERENISQAKQCNDNLFVNPFIRYILEYPKIYLNNRRSDIIEIYKNEKVDRNEIDNLVEIYGIDHLLAFGTDLENENWKSSLCKHLQKHINGYDETCLRREDIFLEHILKVEHDDIDETIWKNYIYYITNRIKVLNYIYRNEKVNVDKYSNIINILKFDLWLGIIGGQCNKKCVELFYEAIVDVFNVAKVAKEKNQQYSYSLYNGKDVFENSIEYLVNRKKRLCNSFSKLYILGKDDIARFEEAFAYEIDLILDNEIVAQMIKDEFKSDLDIEMKYKIERKDDIQEFLLENE